jgi:hypothetical protein
VTRGRRGRNPYPPFCAGVGDNTGGGVTFRDDRGEDGSGVRGEEGTCRASES